MDTSPSDSGPSSLEQFPTLDDIYNEDTARSVGAKIGLAALGVVVTLSFAVWAYAYFFVPEPEREFVDVMDDPSFAVAAEPICAAAKAELRLVPDALQASTVEERVAQVEASNAILSNMIGQLETLPAPNNDRDQRISGQWLEEYRIYVADRQRFADALRVDAEALLTFTDLGTGRIERRLTWLADINEMDSCVPPNDVG